MKNAEGLSNQASRARHGSRLLDGMWSVALAETCRQTYRSPKPPHHVAGFLTDTGFIDRRSSGQYGRSHLQTTSRASPSLPPATATLSACVPNNTRSCPRSSPITAVQPTACSSCSSGWETRKHQTLLRSLDAPIICEPTALAASRSSTVCKFKPPWRDTSGPSSVEK